MTQDIMYEQVLSHTQCYGHNNTESMLQTHITMCVDKSIVK